MAAPLIRGAPAKRHPRKEKIKQRFWRKGLRSIGLAVVVVGLLHAGVILLLRWVDVPISAFMLRTVFQGQRLHYEWVDWQAIAPTLAIAVVASEDQRFPLHHGFDFDAIVDAMEANLKNSALRGASTITQQTAKNLFLWPGRSWIRKGLEAYSTLIIEALWPKRRILEVYLNIVEFGPGVFGVSAASRRFLNTKPDRLTLYDASLLAAVLPNPHQRRVEKPSPYVRRRAADIRRQVTLLGGAAYLTSLK
jgi:monofunctional glycosyltransferase